MLVLHAQASLEGVIVEIGSVLLLLNAAEARELRNRFAFKLPLATPWRRS